MFRRTTKCLLSSRVDSILNSPPLTYNTVSDNEASLVTLGHLLVGKCLFMLFIDGDDTLRS